MNVRLSLSAVVLAASFIAAPAMAQAQVPPAQSGATPQINQEAFRALTLLRLNWQNARARYLDARQSEALALIEYDRATSDLLNALAAAWSPPAGMPPMPPFAVQQKPVTPGVPLLPAVPRP